MLSEAGLNKRPGLNTAIFVTGGGCPPIPGVLEDRHTWCSEVNNLAEQYISRDDVDTVVITGAWSAYFLDHTRVNNPKNYYYYYLDGNNQKQPFKGGDGAMFAFSALESYLKKISQNNRLYFIIDNPSGVRFSPKNIYEGSRLSEFDEKEVFGPHARVEYSLDQRILSEKLVTIARNAGATVIDPSKILCISNECLTTDDRSIPIYKDNIHLRQFFIESHADYVDVTLESSIGD
jgi:hypothetical protein